MQLRARAEAGIGQPGVIQPGKRLGVGRPALALPEGALVPVEPQPAEVVHQKLRALVTGRARI